MTHNFTGTFSDYQNLIFDLSPFPPISLPSLYISLPIYSFIFYLCVFMCVCVRVCHMYVNAHIGQKRALDPLDLELQAVVSHLIRVLEIKLMYSG